jgi:hypothetical protein
VKRFRPGRKDDLGVELRARGPEPSRDFVDTLSERIASDGRRTRMRGASRLSFAAALTVFMLGTLASFGGLGYAASSTKGAFKKVSALEGPSAARTPASDQYVEKVTICHNGHTITISQSALPAHRRHGDTIGPCGVLGASASRTRGGGALGATASGGALPFTGISLAATVLVSLVLMTLGFALRRRANAKQ